MQEKPIDLYQQTEDYFFRALSREVLDFEKFATCYFTGVEVDNLNLLILRELNLDLNNLLKKSTTFFKNHNSKWTALVPSEKMTPQSQKTFEQNNMHFMEESVTMFMPLHEQRAFTKKPSHVEIMKTDAALQDWCRPLLSAFESTPDITGQYQEAHQTALKNGAHFQHYTLFQTGKPISSLTLSHVGTNCRLDDIGTESDYQNQGYATFLINHVLSEAKKAGSQFCFLEASHAGFSVYQKIGFYPLWINQIFGFSSER